MLHIPYIPEPHPDEILGSWLGRISLHNSRGTWFDLLKICGLSDGKPFFDLVDYDANIEQLFVLLGTSYEKVLQELTTLPYWLTFNATNDESVIPGTTQLKMPLNVRGAKMDRISIMGSRRVQGEPISATFCIRCLSEDKERYGDAYWHRSHQLPNIYFCPIHQCELHDRCPNCSKRVLAPKRGLMPLPKQSCDCGCEFASVQLVGRPNSAHLKLGKLSASALDVQAIEWCRADVIFQIKQWFKEDGEHDKFISLLETTFGSIPDPLLHENQLSVTSSMSVPGRKLFFRGAPGVSSAPDFCAMLVALQKDLPEAIQAFKRVRERPADKPRNRYKYPPKYWLQSTVPPKINFERSRIYLERALLLSEAFHAILMSSERPEIITAEKLGNSVNLSHDQVHSVISTHNYLGKSIRDANANLPQRRLQWATSILMSNGDKVSKNAIWNLTGLDTRNPKYKKLWNSFHVEGGKLVFACTNDDISLPI